MADLQAVLKSRHQDAIKVAEAEIAQLTSASSGHNDYPIPGTMTIRILSEPILFRDTLTLQVITKSAFIHHKSVFVKVH